MVKYDMRTKKGRQAAAEEKGLELIFSVVAIPFVLLFNLYKYIFKFCFWAFKSTILLVKWAYKQAKPEIVKLKNQRKNKRKLQ